MAEVTTVDDYLAGFPDDVRAVLERIRATLHAAVPDGTEDISYQIPTIRVDGRAVVYLAGWKQHVSVYPVPAGDAAFEEAIAPYRAGRGTLKFPLHKPIPYELIGRMAALLAEQRGT
ncbi:DUF1801 domain-containing protein [Nocardia sp. 2]|uniref:DUF1801 domain-containing protein n=1 Tax=Nocardia acididurans TaxID=2802282 RepID=A0ABS1LZT8_9NOCA|nr:DUF1801 domain-containing protein [Nocardia acididurans]MBL1073756.1 DUF1801 domain-containing protein [Nocardia acididurans]